MLRTKYSENDFDFAVIYAQDIQEFWIIPVEVFVSYGSQIHLVVAENRQRVSKINDYRNSWSLIQEWAALRETLMCKLVKFGETCNVVIPSQAVKTEGVET
jgi:hypothetical protein